MSTPRLVAFAGYAGTGKDVAGAPLVPLGWERHNFGDIIKGHLDPVITQHFGFSAYTEDRTQKPKIRPLLELWGDANYDGVFREYFARVDACPFESFVNTRLVRTREAEAWRERGGIIVLVERPGVGPATEWEADRLAELQAAGYVDHVLRNDGTVADLHAQVRRLVGL